MIYYVILGFKDVIEFSGICKKRLAHAKQVVVDLDLDCKSVIDALQDELNENQLALEKIYNEMEFYGYSKARSAPLEFFSFWVDFISTFELSKKWLLDEKKINRRKTRAANNMRNSILQNVSSGGSNPSLGNTSIRSSIIHLRESSEVHVNLRNSMYPRNE